MTELFRAHWHTVHGYLTRRTGDPVLAEELAQETFVRATRAFLGFRGGSPAGWLLAIARNVLVDHHRRGRRLVPLEESMVPAQGSGDAEVELRDLLSRLPAPTRRLLELAYVDGFSHAEIAGMTNQTPQAVRSALWRARAAARALIEEQT